MAIRPVTMPVACEADYVHDIAYDYHGKRLAICTSSKRISIFTEVPAKDKDPGGVDGTNWEETGRIEQAHSGPIWRLNWGHPEWGEPLASCSEDRSVSIWFDKYHNCGRPEEDLKSSVKEQRWVKRANLQGGGPLLAVRFAPAHLGLKFATCSADGKVRLFECMDLLTLKAWNNDNQGEDLEPTKSLTAAAQKREKFSNLEKEEASSSVSQPMPSASLDWMPAPLGGNIFGDEKGEMFALVRPVKGLQIWTRSTKGNRWVDAANADEACGAAEMPHFENPIKDVAWCPNICRNYEIIATVGFGACLWRVDWQPAEGKEKQGPIPGVVLKISLLKQLIPAHKMSPADEPCLVWRCCWNLVGTCLLLSAEDGEVSLYKTNAALEWEKEFAVDYGESDDYVSESGN